PIADMLTRIRNGSKAKFEKIDIPLSKQKLEIAKILKQEGYIRNFKVLSEGVKGTLGVYLKYDTQNRSIINGIKRVSKPGLRVYVKSKKIVPVLNGFGISIISTPQGIMTDKEAKKMNLGGEVICLVW
ncbi:MAG: 30S ribosomal protein S8, partial [Desulfobacterota bacterium]|nr:30S ribosomal protein S8 [Thermodesulfobacteriota bacterium]